MLAKRSRRAWRYRTDVAPRGQRMSSRSRAMPSAGTQLSGISTACGGSWAALHSLEAAAAAGMQLLALPPSADGGARVGLHR